MTSRLIAIVLSSLLLGGCYVRLPISKAVAEPISAKEAAAMSEQRGELPGAGKWFRVRVHLPRESVQKISRWELYTHIYVEGCSTRELVGVASEAGIEGEGSDFGRVRELLRAEPRRQDFILSEPVFMRAGKTSDRLCLRLNGGSYTLQKVITERVPLRLKPASA